mmetsp:Transcript_49269/g.56608  ORF Transcript_49269/g.56608 Transcript_49269/m.56608 type:complete len:147 (-) Transcript_49269:112-552(-)
MALSNRILENLFISDMYFAQQKSELDALRITHILVIGHNLIAYHDEADFVYHFIDVEDSPEANLKKYFDEIVQFIHSGCSQPDGRVLVHCAMGVSRSSTAIIAYLMKIQKMKFNAALQYVKELHPYCRPNDGFVEQLQEFEKELKL